MIFKNLIFFSIFEKIPADTTGELREASVFNESEIKTFYRLQFTVYSLQFSINQLFSKGESKSIGQHHKTRNQSMFHYPKLLYYTTCQQVIRNPLQWNYLFMYFE